jgi:ribose 5-phosphate isomerase A
LTNPDLEKQAAARASIRFVREGDIVGLGSGSTAHHAVRFLAERVRAGLNIKGIPTSEDTARLATELGIPLVTLDQYQKIDVDIDGADEFDPQLNLIKGGGAAFLREKVVAAAAAKIVIVADSSKQVPCLGKFPLPVEVIPFALTPVKKKIEALGAAVAVRSDKAGRPFVTDEGNRILDCKFGQIPDPAGLAQALANIPGAIAHGLFIGMTSVVLIGKGREVIELKGPATNLRFP